MRSLLALILILISGSQLLHAQIPIKGFVYELDVNNKRIPLPFANIHWEGTTKGTIADESGNFTIKPVVNSSKIIASFVGFANDTVVVNGQARIELVLAKGTELAQVEVKEKLDGSYISKLKPIKTEVITTAGLQKLACCNLF